MGSSASKTSRAASSAVRKYPSRVPHTSQTTHQRQTPAYKPEPQPDPSPAAQQQPSSSPAQDSELTARMLKLGPASVPSSSFPAAVQSNPQQPIFPSPSSNPAVTLLAARAKLAGQAEAELEEFARQGMGTRGREFLDVTTIRRVLIMKDEKKLADAEIEKSLGLKSGTVGRLGRGVVGPA